MNAEAVEVLPFVVTDLPMGIIHTPKFPPVNI